MQAERKWIFTEQQSACREKKNKKSVGIDESANVKREVICFVASRRLHIQGLSRLELLDQHIALPPYTKLRRLVNTELCLMQNTWKHERQRSCCEPVWRIKEPKFYYSHISGFKLSCTLLRAGYGTYVNHTAFREHFVFLPALQIVFVLSFPCRRLGSRPVTSQGNCSPAEPKAWF